MQDLKVTLIQANLVWEDPRYNLDNFSKKLKQLKNKPDLVVLPEMFNTGFTMNVDKCAETMIGKSFQWLQEKAGELNCVVAGSLLIKEDNKYFNRFIWMLPDGSCETYDKRHLFRMSNEHKTMSQGNERKIVNLKNWKINLQVCYDLRFPVWIKNAYHNNIHDYGSGYLVKFNYSETYNTRLAGFKLSTSSLLNIIHCDNSSPIIENNIINQGHNWGIRCENSAAPQIRNNHFYKSQSFGGSGFSSIRIMDSEPIIFGNTFYGPGYGQIGYHAIEHNTLDNVNIYNNYIYDFYDGIVTGGTGDITGNLIESCFMAISIGGDEIRLINNTIVNSQYGLYNQYGTVEIYNCIFYENFINIYPTTICSVKNSCVENGLSVNATDLGGNIFIDPIFNNPMNHDYTIVHYSPCVEAGTIDTTGLLLPDYDYFLNGRIQDGNNDSIAIIDMGFYESYQISNPGYIQGNVTLVGGTGNVEDVLVGVGATTSPDASGNYTITISPDGSPYTIKAQLDGYLTQTIQNVIVNAGQTTSGIDFILEPYNPSNCLKITPEIIYFLDEMSVWYGVEVEITNDCLMDITIADVYCGNYSWSFCLEPDYFTPMILSAGESYSFTVFPDIILDSVSEEIVVDSLFIFTNLDYYAIEILLDKDLVFYAVDKIINNEFELNIFPNPFSKSTHIEFVSDTPQVVTFKIVNNMGVIIESRSFQENREIKFDWDTGSGKIKTKPGLYFCQIIINGSIVATKKILLTH